MGKIIVLGSINMDVVATTPNHPQLGETVFGDELYFLPGGKGANQAVAASRLDGQVTLVGRMGKDAFGDTLHPFLSNEKLNMDYVVRMDDAPTGTAIITVNSDSENTIVVISGANAKITVEDTEAVPVGAGDVIVSQFEVPQVAIKTLFERAKSQGAQTVINPAPAGAFVDGLLNLVDYLVVNETELAFLAEAPLTDDLDTLQQQAISLRTRPDQTVIVTLGAKGVLCVHGDDVIHVEGRKVKAVDTTGAGDCFVGALSVALAENKPLADALQFANQAAALSVQKLGAAVSLPHRKDMDSA